MQTITMLTRADARIPTTRIAVITSTITIAGRFTEGSSPAIDVGSEMPGVVEQRREVARPADGDGGCAERELEDQVPADDPRDQLADRRVRERVGRTGDRHGRGELRVAQRGQRAGDRGHDERERHGRSGARGGGDPGEHEDAGADDHADAPGGQREHAELAPELVLRILRLGDGLLDALGSEDRPRRRPVGAGHVGALTRRCCETNDRARARAPAGRSRRAGGSARSAADPRRCSESPRAT